MLEGDSGIWMTKNRGERRSSLGATDLKGAFVKLGYGPKDDMDEETQYRLFNETTRPVKEQLHMITKSKHVNLDRAARNRDLIAQFEREVFCYAMCCCNLTSN
jgi:hypothetical protein